MTARPGIARRRPSIAWAIAASFALHAIFATALFSAHPAPRRALPPSYHVNLVAAPPEPAAAPAPAPPAAPPPAPSPPPKKAVPPPKAMAAPPKLAPKTPPKKTPPAPPNPAPPAPPNPTPPAPSTAGRGNDVVTVQSEGAEFPYPQYLENVVRVIAQRFKPQGNSAVRAEVSFIIRRDGSIVPSSIQFVTRSGNFAFDLEAEGAVEQAAAVKAFGPLPTGFADDVLPVVFSFDPRVLRSP